MPLITPVDGFRATPAGTVPEVMDQVYGAVPPAAVRVAEYGAPAAPPGRDVVVIVRPDPRAMRTKVPTGLFHAPPSAIHKAPSGPLVNKEFAGFRESSREK